MSLIEQLNWRYATKKMNGQTVPAEKVEYILNAAQLAPSSSGLQPFEIIVITNKELLEKIKPIAYNQSQITDASHLLVFAAWDNYTKERIDTVFAYNNAIRGLPDSATEEYKTRLSGLYLPRTAEENHQHAAKQAYIAFGTAIIAAAEQNVDTTPMEGFEADKLDDLLNLKDKGLRSVVILPLGYRDADNDWLAKLKKVRKPKEEFITELA